MLRRGTGLVVLALILVVIEIRVLGVRVVFFLVVLERLAIRRLTRSRSAQLIGQTREVSPAAAVLQLAGDLRLLGLCPAAPHGSTPSNTGPGGPRGLTRVRDL